VLVLLAAPAAWAAQTLGHPTSSTFPAGGPADASALGGGFAGPGGAGLRRRGGLGFGFGAPGGRLRFGAGPPGAFRGAIPPGRGFGGAGGAGGFTGPGFGGGFGGNSADVTAVESYARAHGGGTIGVSSQSSAAAAILASDANVAGLGGFSGRESSVTARWIAMEVGAGRLRWVLTEGGGAPRAPGDQRAGSQAAMSVVAKACRAVNVAATGAAKLTVYDCQGRAREILAVSASKR
jgi:hypothetical protein